jgi:uncharacterized membrane protein YphA (DoxX/SURF4 family)
VKQNFFLILVFMKLNKIVLWTGIGILGIMFMFAGATKLIGLQIHLDNFDRWGLPTWLMYSVGVVEILAAAGVVLEKFRALGTYIIIAIMIGAIGTHVLAGEIDKIPMNVFLIAAAVLVNRFHNKNKDAKEV